MQKLINKDRKSGRILKSLKAGAGRSSDLLHARAQFMQTLHSCQSSTLSQFQGLTTLERQGAARAQLHQTPSSIRLQQWLVFSFRAVF